MGSCAFLWDGARFLMTAMGKFAAEHGANILNLPARRKCYEQRLERYFNRGYDLVLPRLNARKLVGENGHLPFMSAYIPFKYPDDRLVALSLRAQHRDRAPESAAPDSASAGVAPEETKIPKEHSNYSIGVPYGHSRALLSRNVRALDPGDGKIYVGALVAELDLSENTGKTVSLCAIEPVLNAEALAAQVNYAFRATIPNIKTIRALLGKYFAMELVTDYLSTGEAPPLERIRRACDARVALLTPHAKIPFAFMRVEENTGLIEPSKRVAMPEEEWYGPCYQA